MLTYFLPNVPSIQLPVGRIIGCAIIQVRNRVCFSCSIEVKKETNPFFSIVVLVYWDISSGSGLLGLLLIVGRVMFCQGRVDDGVVLIVGRVMSRQGRVDIVVLACLDIGGLLLRMNGFSVPFVSQLTYEAWLKRISIVDLFHLDIGGLLWSGEIVVVNVVLDVWNIGEIWLLMLLWLISFIALLRIVYLAPNVVELR